MIYVNTTAVLEKMPEIEKAIKYIKEHGKEAEDGIVRLDGENLFINFQTYSTLDRTECKFESHKDYIDVQYIIEGEEIIAVTTPGLLSISEPYNKDKDIIFYNDIAEGELYYLTKDNFVILEPIDVHMPKIKMNEPCKVKKAVAKIKI